MKRLIYLCVFMLFCVGMLPALAAESDDIDIYIKSGKYADGGYTLTYKTENTDIEPFSGTVAFAALDSYGRLVLLSSVQAELGGEKSVYDKISLRGLREDFCDLRVFIWDSFSAMEPKKPSLSIDFSDIPEPLENESYYFFEEPFASLGEIPETVVVGGISFNRPADSREIRINTNSCVELGGGGNMTKCSLGFKVKGSCTINVWARSRSTEEARVVKLGDAYSELMYFDAPADRINKGTYVYEGGETELYVASKAAAVMIYAIEVIYEEDGDESADVWSVADYESLRRAIWKAGINGGGTIIINAGTINCKDSLVLENTGEGTITICGGEGYEAILDFDEFRKSFDEDDMYMPAGLIIRGNNYVIRDIIIQNTPYIALRLHKGAGNNRIENVVARYNGGNGFAVSDEAHDNTFKNCYAYRNCDIITKGQNADGFWVAFYAGTGNRLIDCYSWENADDGFDSFNMFNDVYYENCFAWRNGTADIFTGKFDFDRGRPLDENLHLVRRICEYDSSFKEKYANGIFELPQGEFLLTTPTNEVVFSYISAQDFSGTEWCGNGNGIKLGSGSSSTTERPQVGPEAVRTMINCITFEHHSKGFDRNNSDCTVYIKNGLSFDNYRNYWLDTCTIKQFDNVLSAVTDKNLFPTENEVTYLNQAQLGKAKEFIYERIDVLESMVKSDEIPSGICFERVFDILEQ